MAGGRSRGLLSSRTRPVLRREVEGFGLCLEYQGLGFRVWGLRVLFRVAGFRV